MATTKNPSNDLRVTVRGRISSGSRRPFLAAAALGLAMTTVACSDDGSSDADPLVDSGETVPTEPVDQTPAEEAPADEPAEEPAEE